MANLQMYTANNRIMDHIPGFSAGEALSSLEAGHGAYSLSSLPATLGDWSVTPSEDVAVFRNSYYQSQVIDHPPVLSRRWYLTVQVETVQADNLWRFSLPLQPVGFQGLLL